MASRTKKILIGCGLGCGGLIVVVVIGFFSFAAWLKRPGEVLQPTRLLGADTTGYAEWTLSLDDPGTAEFVEGLLDRQEEMQPDLFPPTIQAFFNNWNSNRNRKEIQNLFPIVAAWTLSPGPETDQDRNVFALSVRGFGNQLVFADWIMSFIAGNDPDFQRIDHQDEIIFRFNDSAFFFLRRAHIFFAEDLQTARSAVDRLQPEPVRTRQEGPLEALFAGVPEEPPLRAAISNGSGEMLRTWRLFALAPEDPEELRESMSQLRGAVLTGSLEAGETLNAQLSLQAPDPAWAEEHAAEALRNFRQGMAFEDLALSSSVRTEGDWIRIDFRAEGLLAFVGSLLDVSVSNIPGVLVIDLSADTDDNPELN